uniref:Uncharacterized protein n=1 Tax=Physcomitrium patens TaxID=3218 RepID=A0A7I4B899_PHYPA
MMGIVEQCGIEEGNGVCAGDGWRFVVRHGVVGKGASGAVGAEWVWEMGGWGEVEDDGEVWGAAGDVGVEHWRIVGRVVCRRVLRVQMRGEEVSGEACDVGGCGVVEGVGKGGRGLGTEVGLWVAVELTRGRGCEHGGCQHWCAKGEECVRRFSALLRCGGQERVRGSPGEGEGGVQRRPEQTAENAGGTELGREKCGA